jgi:hypothetical protein
MFIECLIVFVRFSRMEVVEALFEQIKAHPFVALINPYFEDLKIDKINWLYVVVTVSVSSYLWETYLKY